MANTNKIPSLTEAGYIDNKNLQLAKLFGYFMAADYSQSNVFRGGIQSLKYLLGKHLSPSGLGLAIKNSLKALYAPYFDNVYVEVSQEHLKNNIVNIHIDVLCVDDNKEYQLSREIKTKEGNMVEFENSLDELYQYYKGE